jgi:hypothetical protein
VRDAETFIRLHFSNNESLDVTPHHIFTLADGSPMRAERLCLSDIFVGRFARLTLLRIEAISATAARSASVGAQHAVPGTDTWRDSSHPPQPAGNEASVGAWHAMPGTNTWRDVASSASPDRHRHPERSAPLSSSVFADSANTAAHQEGLPGRRLVEPGRSVEGPLLDVPPGNQSTTKRDPSSASRGRTLRGESQTARDSAQDDGSQFGAEVEARGIGLAKSPQATAAPMEARSASPAASPKADASPVEARGFSPAKSAPQREGLQPRASTPAAPGSSCSAGILPANLPWTSDAAPWQKVTITCEPSHQFFAGRHSASILTHNYTFSS